LPFLLQFPQVRVLQVRRKGIVKGDYQPRKAIKKSKTEKITDDESHYRSHQQIKDASFSTLFCEFPGSVNCVRIFFAKPPIKRCAREVLQRGSESSHTTARDLNSFVDFPLDKTAM